MKIISKFKDYFDFLQGIYGVDEKKILDRSKSIPIQLSEIEYHHSTYYALYIFFCGRVYVRVDRVIWDYYLEKSWEARPKREYSWGREHGIHTNVETAQKTPDFTWILLKKYSSITEFAYGGYVSTIDKEKIWEIYMYKSSRFKPYPNLGELGFNKVMDPQTCYVKIDQWLSVKDPSMPSDPTDIQRFEGKGFDKKTSFRQ